MVCVNPQKKNVVCRAHSKSPTVQPMWAWSDKFVEFQIVLLWKRVCEACREAPYVYPGGTLSGHPSECTLVFSRSATQNILKRTSQRDQGRIIIWGWKSQSLEKGKRKGKMVKYFILIDSIPSVGYDQRRGLTPLEAETHTIPYQNTTLISNGTARTGLTVGARITITAKISRWLAQIIENTREELDSTLRNVQRTVLFSIDYRFEYNHVHTTRVELLHSLSIQLLIQVADILEV